MKFLCTLFLTGILSTQSYGQQTTFSEGYYVIVGAFAQKSNAEKFNAELHNRQMKSNYGYLPSRGLYYVYTLNDQDAERCKQVAQELRKEPTFYDAWVRYINEELSPGSFENELRDSETAIAVRSEETVTARVENKVTPEQDAPLIEIPKIDEVTVGNTEAFLSLYNEENDKVAQGNVQVVDTERSRLIEEVKGNEYVNLPNPKSKSGKISLICDVIGYRRIQKDLDYNDPLADSIATELIGTTLVVHFDLKRYQKGDIRVLFNIYFYNDAAIMMPESKYELNGLLNMMKDNPNYRIKLHGHTNGSYHGKIIKRGPSGDFFSVAKDAVTMRGSSMKLSESRAEIIREYLIDNGIDDSRVETKAWGGKRPIYPKHSANAKKNIRVEVEIIND